MKRRSAIRHLLVAGAASCCPRLVTGNPENEEPNYTIHSDVRLVLLDVSVEGPRSGYVSGLSIDNFRVLENGRPQSITVFDDNDIPVTVGILVDESRSMAPKRAEVLTAAQSFIEESNPLDQIFVLNFNEKVRRGLPDETLFSDNAQQLRSALNRGMPEGRTALHDAIVAGLEQLELGRRDKKALIVITDGGDNASENTRKEMFDRVERSIATIYTIGLFDAEDTDRAPGILRRLAAISGGEAYFPLDPSGVVPACHRIAKYIRSRYTIGYVPQAGNSAGLRHIDVRVSAPGHARLTVHTRTSYRY